ncbi:MAG: hypothetical protein IPH46_17430 [Bacteroidetes bacterium]|nr:hypothetical protein [Bacteroidota bacterium]
MKTKIFPILTLVGLMVTGLTPLLLANVNPVQLVVVRLCFRTTVNISSLTNAAGDFTAKTPFLTVPKRMFWTITTLTQQESIM